MPAADTPPEAPKFGTSGLRGLVVALTDDLVARHVAGFVTACDAGETVLIGEDLRPSSPDIARMAARAVVASGARAVLCGPLPTPALALAAGAGGTGAIMVTGSHIPADRNGLKFYTIAGEITKEDEAAITRAARSPAPALPDAPDHDPGRNSAISDAYKARYATAFGPDALAGMRLGLYRHSGVARDLLADILTALGADVTPLGQSDTFIPVDTEAVSDATRALLTGWADQGFDAILSTDGDADRPLLADADGRVIPGDVLGPLTAQAVGASHVVTPLTSNAMLERMGVFGTILRTRIGSPHVIAGMAECAGENVVGFEANGGFLLGFTADMAHGPLPPLATRDAALPLIAPLVLAKSRNEALSQLISALPVAHAAGDRLQEIDRPRAEALLEKMARDPAARADFLGAPDASCDLTDGVRMTLQTGEIVHLRLSGNAAELRCYTEAESDAAAATLLARALTRATDLLKA